MTMTSKELANEVVGKRLTTLMKVLMALVEHKPTGRYVTVLARPGTTAALWKELSDNLDAKFYAAMRPDAKFYGQSQEAAAVGFWVGGEEHATHVTVRDQSDFYIYEN